MWEKIKTFAEKHPVALGVIVFVVGAIIIYFLLRGGGSAQTSSTDPNAAYYNAAAAATQYGDQLQAAQDQLQAGAAQTQAQLTASQDTNATQLAIVNSNNAAAVTLGQAQINEQGVEANLAAQTQDYTSNLAMQVAESNNSVAVQTAQLAAGVETQTTQAQAALSEAAISAGVQANNNATGLASLQAMYLAGESTQDAVNMNTLLNYQGVALNTLANASAAKTA
jgi:hypothetical protein